MAPRRSKQWHLDRFGAVARRPGRIERRDDRAHRIGRRSTARRRRSARAGGSADHRRRRFVGSAGARRAAGAAGSLHHGRHRTHAPCRRCRRTDRRAVRPLEPETLRTDRRPSTCHPDRSSLQPVRPRAAAGAMPRTRAGLPRRHRRRDRRLRRARTAGPGARAAGGALNGADDRVRHGAGPVDRGTLVVAAFSGRATPCPPRPTGGSSGCVSSGKRTVDARSLHVSRRLALVVHGALSPQDAAARTCAATISRSKPRAAALPARIEIRGADADVGPPRSRSAAHGLPIDVRKTSHVNAVTAGQLSDRIDGAPRAPDPGRPGRLLPPRRWRRSSTPRSGELARAQTAHNRRATSVPCSMPSRRGPGVTRWCASASGPNRISGRGDGGTRSRRMRLRRRL